ncbi:hypothetical protein EP12_05160 [Alteromonas australica]|nr:hypothetical protein EP12_05160 [Alteromonas australica]
MKLYYYFLQFVVPEKLKRLMFSFSTRAILRCKTVSDRNIVLYGAGYLGIEVYIRFKKKGIPVYKWVDIKANTMPFKQFDIEIEATTELANLEPRTKILICSQATVKPMFKECLKRGILEKDIIVID